MTVLSLPDLMAQTRDAMISGKGVINTPFGLRPLVYADYAASGRGDRRIEAQLAQIQALYANPHTDDSATGRSATAWLKRSETMIKQALHAGPDDVVLACGSGATGAIERLQQILGVYEAPATRAAHEKALIAALGADAASELVDRMKAQAPVVFVGPYEHHSNELTWRESRAQVVRIGLTADGAIDLSELEAELQRSEYSGRQKIGAFSAASNVTGMKTDVPGLARLLHAHDAILCLDCAASAPYLPIDMNPTDAPQDAPDAVYFSPHKFIGGPGACGVLVFKAHLYRQDLAPSFSGGGTVTYVTPTDHDFISDIAARERAGTPGVLQMARAALALNLIGQVGYTVIEAREQTALRMAFESWQEDPAIEILGSSEVERRIGIVAFNIKSEDGDILHPRYVATLLNDLFGIQVRAGCSCAGPYAHALLDLDEARTQECREAVLSGYAGMRPGWCRLSLHWVMSQEEVEYIIQAVKFVAAYGLRFLALYRFDVATGGWRARESDEGLGLIAEHGGSALMDEAMRDAQEWAERLGECVVTGQLPDAVEKIRRFPVPA